MLTVQDLQDFKAELLAEIKALLPAEKEPEPVIAIPASLYFNLQLKKELTVNKLTDLAKWLGINTTDRHREIITLRHNFRYFLYFNTSLSLKQIAVITGYVKPADHATILNSVKTASNLIKTETLYKENYKHFADVIKNRFLDIKLKDDLDILKIYQYIPRGARFL